MTVLTYYGTLYRLTCWCGIRFAVPTELADQALNHRHEIYCPLGHTCRWRETELDRVRRRSERLAAQLTSAQDQLGASERSRAALRGVVTRTKRRVANGVCPVQGCKRHFKNVEAHISRMHPDYRESDA